MQKNNNVMKHHSVMNLGNQIEGTNYRILWYSIIQFDIKIQAWKLGIVIINKTKMGVKVKCQVNERGIGKTDK